MKKSVIKQFTIASVFMNSDHKSDNPDFGVFDQTEVDSFENIWNICVWIFCGLCQGLVVWALLKCAKNCFFWPNSNFGFVFCNIIENVVLQSRRGGRGHGIAALLPQMEQLSVEHDVRVPPPVENAVVCGRHSRLQRSVSQSSQGT